MSLGEFQILTETTTEQQKRPAPNKDPTLYSIAPSVPDATKAVMTSPAPLARAIKVTAAKGSESFNHSLI